VPRTVALLCARFALAAPTGIAQQKGPKVFFSADMEGIWRGGLMARTSVRS
jgi:hypothetical protein